MINSQMKNYDYYTLGELNQYGQRVLKDTPDGTIKMAVYILNQNTNESILYTDASYVGLTTTEGITDKYVIDYVDKDTNEHIKLKVLYVNPMGRLKQVFMAVIK